ncbi:hypothetical protein ABT039_29440 [Streptomyces lasiicapitis]|uniref:hypothetical protein n=1 Tax=Streptomyces lasiicapitis TaxID=1923961 RepID=UPI003324C7DC
MRGRMLLTEEAFTLATVARNDRLRAPHRIRSPVPLDPLPPWTREGGQDGPHTRQFTQT